MHLQVPPGQGKVSLSEMLDSGQVSLSRQVSPFMFPGEEPLGPELPHGVVNPEEDQQRYQIYSEELPEGHGTSDSGNRRTSRGLPRSEKRAVEAGFPIRSGYGRRMCPAGAGTAMAAGPGPA